MIINTGSRTDIPAYYSEWFMNRIREGYVMARNPFYPSQVLKYTLDPSAVDCLVFCTKNPKPMLKYIDELKEFNQFWFVTITPYAKDIEPNVVDKHEVIEVTKELSKKLGKNCVSVRYDPIFISEKYDKAYHKRAFRKIISELDGYVEEVVISFIDLYKKTIKNFKEVKEVSYSDQKEIVKEFVSITKEYNMELRTCLENREFEKYGVNINGCMSQDVIERAIKEKLIIKKDIKTREGCECLLGNDIGAYNTCGHLCKYCYANYDEKIVRENMKKHDKHSPLLIGNIKEGDTIKEVKQTSWIDKQIRLDI